MTESRRRVNILHVRVVSGSGGGPDKTIARSAAYSDVEKFDIVSAYLYPKGSREIQEIYKAHAQHKQLMYGIPERGPVDFASVGELVRLCKARQVDIWHGHDYKSDVLGRIVRRFHAMKVMTTVHGFTRETWRTRLYAKVNDLALPGMDHVTAVSPNLVEHCALCGVNPSRLSYVPNGVEIDRWQRQQSAEAAKKAIGLPADCFTIGVVGRLSIEKGVHRALRLFAHMLAGGLQARLLIIGDGPERKKLESLAQTLGISVNVQWAGWHSDTRRFYEAMDLLLLTSVTEGLPNAILEAMAMGIPVAATSVGGVPQVLDGGRCGLLLEQDESKWPEAVVSLCKNQQKRQQLSALGRERVEQSYNFEFQMRKITNIYENLMGVSITTTDANRGL